MNARFSVRPRIYASGATSITPDAKDWRFENRAWKENPFYHRLGQAYLAVNWEATPNEVAHFIQPHPSFSEVFGETVLALTGRGLHVG